MTLRTGMTRPAMTALALGLTPLLALAAGPTAEATLAAQMKQLMERVQQLDQRNQALERRVQELSQAKAALAPAAAQATAGQTQRLKEVETQQQALRQEVQALSTRVPEVSSDAPEEELKIETTLAAVYQHVNSKGTSNGIGQSRANYRGDVLVTLPAGSVGSAQAQAVGQLRFGQGSGLGLRTTHTSALNSTTFQAGAGSAQTYAVVAQAYYQLEWPLDGGRFNDHAGSRFTLNVGKMDVFGFFDQNEVAGDETTGFLNNVFVHNPLLDSGGDIAADDFGFAPGVRAAWYHEGEKWGFGASLGAYASGSAATFGASGAQPLVIAQLQASPKQINGEARGNYRLYAWTNGHTKNFSDVQERHSGVGMSLDQRVGAALNLFARYGKRTSGQGRFNDAITLGLEYGGRAWGRAHDAVGVAVAQLKTSAAWRDATIGNSTLTGYAALANEQATELFYRFKVNNHLALTPNVQLLQNLGGNPAARSVRALGLRATLSFGN